MMWPQKITNSEGIAMLKFFEAGGGFEEHAYWDKTGKVWTIGWGFTLGVKEGDFMTEEEGNARLYEEIKEYECGVQNLLTVEPTSNQFSAMVVLSWNIGLHPEKGFPISDVLKYHNLANFERAANSFKNWSKSGGVILPGLVKRRAAEAALYRKKDNAEVEVQHP